MDETQKSRWKKVLLILLLVLAGGALTVYAAGCWFFSEHYYYGTVINGVVYGCLTAPEVKQDLQNRYSDYELCMIGRGGLTDSLRAQEAGIVIEPDEELQRILMEDQPCYLWPEGFFYSHDYMLEQLSRIDEELFAEAVRGTVFFDKRYAEKPRDAFLSGYSRTAKGYHIVPEKMGKQPVESAFIEAAKSAAYGMCERVELTDDTCYVQPMVFADDADLNKKMTLLNQYVGFSIQYDMHGIPVTVDGDLIHEWILEQDGEIHVDEEKVAAYVKELANTYNTVKQKQRFVTARGNEIEIRGGSYGWVMDEKAETEALLTMLQDKKDVRYTPKWKSKGYQLGVGNPESSYVEVDMGAQHLYLIEGGKIVFETDIVTGNMAAGCATPTGIYRVYSKQKNRILRGANYASFVYYWMPFYRGYGMHDATWRASFGGTIYQTNGSHGCVNLPKDAAGEIYNRVSVGTPVVLYY